MQLEKVNNLRFWFYGIWILLTLFQAGFTELMDDEAFYWVYGQNLDWGQLHHPPMVALLVKIGYTILPTAFGVRLPFVVLHLVTIWLIEQLIDKKNTAVFVAFVASIAILHIGGFLAVPDTPFVFFTALFLYFTKSYLQKDSLILALAIGVSIAGMFYSKYNAIVIVFFAIIANWQLFKRWTFYVAGISALLLFLPHLYWEYLNDYVTFQFHWTERNKMKWHFGLTLTYIISTVIILGPLVSFQLLKETTLYKSGSPFEKTLKYVGLGILGFFLFTSFKGRTEANWVVAALIPMIALSVNVLSESPKKQVWLYRLLPLSLMIALFARVVIVIDILPKEISALQKLRDFHGVEDVIIPLKETIEKEGNHPPIFAGSYQLPSKYAFYTGKFATAIASATGSRTQFDLYHWEQAFVGDTVLFFARYPMRPCDSLVTSTGTIYYQKIKDFRAYTTVKLETEKEFSFPPDSLVTVEVNFEIPEDVTFEGDKKSHLSCQIFKYSKFLGHQDDSQALIDIDTSKPYAFKFRTPKEKGEYRMNISIQSPMIFSVHNTPRLKLVIE